MSLVTEMAKLLRRTLQDESYGERPIDFSRPILRNSDDSISTELTSTFEIDGKHLVLPTIIYGKRYSPADALKLYREGVNKPVGIFPSAEEANAYARNRSTQIGKLRGLTIKNGT